MYPAKWNFWSSVHTLVELSNEFQSGNKSKIPSSSQKLLERQCFKLICDGILLPLLNLQQEQLWLSVLETITPQIPVPLAWGTASCSHMQHRSPSRAVVPLPAGDKGLAKPVHCPVLHRPCCFGVPRVQYEAFGDSPVGTLSPVRVCCLVTAVSLWLCLFLSLSLFLLRPY